ncbi:outer membrane protein [Apibacter mensalis]|uniref:Outer membrane protein n=1 Tax=Apibacter mensalis TaxID=1586267 RepID=A0A0X8XZJ6_9FLAO|nr:TolC family protein [Apibacter mensalis]CVK15789.1 outer membrane protein [Apibacter mensalis]
MKLNNSIIAFFIVGFISAQKVWSFNDCLSYARENNLQVLASKLNEQVQESNLKIAKKEKLPDLKGTITNGITFGPLATQKVTQNGITDFTIDSYYKYTEGYQNNLALESSMILYNNRRLRLNEEKNSFLVQQNQYTTEKIKNDISLQLVGNYLTVLLNKELLGVQYNSMDIQAKEKDRNEKLYTAGSIPLSTLYESKSNLANAKQTYENAKIEVDRSLMVLAMLLQKDYRDFQIEDVKVSDDIGMPLINLDDIINYAFNNQPSIKSAELGVESAKKDIDIAKTAFYPSITGGYKVSTFYQDYFDRSNKSIDDQWYDNHSQMLSVGVNIPIFSKGTNKIKVQQSRINQLLQENQLDQEKLNLKQNIQTSYFDVNTAYQTFTSAKELVSSTELSYEFAQKSFTAGKINIYDLNTARNNYFNALSQMLQAKYSFLFRLKILDFYIGKPLEISSDESVNYNNLTPSKETIQAINDLTSTDVEIKKPEILKPNNNIPEIKGTNLSTPNTSANIKSGKAIDAKSKDEFKTSIGTVKTSTDISNNASQPIKNAPANSKDMTVKSTNKNSSAKPLSKTEADAKREALIKERRLKYSQGARPQFQNDAQREALIKERRAKLSKGIYD